MVHIARRSLLTACLAAIAAVFAAGSEARAYPEPNIVPSSWELTAETRAPGVIAVVLPGSDEPKLYYYMTYTVTNRTGEEQLFIPDVWLMTNAGDLLQANRGVPPIVFDRIKQRAGNTLLERPTQVVGPLLQGPDNARDSVAIWPVPDHDVDHISIFFGGLSGETHVVKDAEGRDKILKKVLMLEYATPGDASHTAGKPFIAKGKRWVVR